MYSSKHGVTGLSGRRPGDHGTGLQAVRESFRGLDHLAAIQKQAREIIAAAIG